MKTLLTPEIAAKLQAQYPLGAEMSTQVVVAKIFDTTGSWSWYLMNQDASDPDYLWAIVDGFEIEAGSVSLSEMESIGSLERDESFKEINALELWKGLHAKKYVDGGRLKQGNALREGAVYELVNGEKIIIGKRFFVLGANRLPEPLPVLDDEQRSMLELWVEYERIKEGVKIDESGNHANGKILESSMRSLITFLNNWKGKEVFDAKYDAGGLTLAAVGIAATAGIITSLAQKATDHAIKHKHLLFGQRLPEKVRTYVGKGEDGKRERMFEIYRAGEWMKTSRTKFDSFIRQKGSTHHLLYKKRKSQGKYSIYALNKSEYEDGGGVGGGNPFEDTPENKKIDEKILVLLKKFDSEGLSGEDIQGINKKISELVKSKTKKRKKTDADKRRELEIEIALEQKMTGEDEGERNAGEDEFSGGGGVGGEIQDEMKMLEWDLATAQGQLHDETDADKRQELEIEIEGYQIQIKALEQKMTGEDAVKIESRRKFYEGLFQGGGGVGVTAAPEGYVFTVLGSHRAREKAERKNIKYISLYSFGAQRAAGISNIMTSEKDYDLIKDITGVGSARKTINGEWFARHEDDGLHSLFRSGIAKNESLDTPRALGDALKRAFKTKYGVDIGTEYIKTVRGLDGSRTRISTWKSKQIIPNEARLEIIELYYGKPVAEIGVNDPHNIYYGTFTPSSISVEGRVWKEWLSKGR